MQREKLLKEFSVLNCIQDYDCLEKYVDFCIENHQEEKFKSSTHHILPQAKSLPFVKFKNLKIYTWNRCELSHYNHYIAHYLLTKAIKHLAIHTAFCAMHYKDYKRQFISDVELLEEKEFNKIYEERNKLLSEFLLEKVEYNGEIVTRASIRLKNRKLTQEQIQKMSERMSGDKNIVHLDGVVSKIRQTKSTKTIDGKNMDTISSERAANTMKQKYKSEDGKETTIYEQNGLKISKTLNNPFTDKDGNITSLGKVRGKYHSKSMISKGKFYLLKNVFDDSIYRILPAIEIRKISPGLEKKTKDDYLGKSKFGANLFSKRGDHHLIGLYVEEHLPILQSCIPEKDHIQDQ